MIRKHAFLFLLAGFWILDSGFWIAAQAEIPAYQITYAQVKDGIAAALEHEKAGENIRVIIPRKDDEIVVSHRAPISAEVGDLTFDARSRTWRGTLFFAAEEKPLAPVPLTGRFEAMREIPMLKHRVGSGETITEDDVELVAYAEQRLQKEIVTDAARLIGKSPKRTVSAGRPVRITEIVTPPVVMKGDRVSLMYHTPSMEIRTLGEALENGAPGETIRIRNDASHIVVQATVTGAGAAQVVPAGMAGGMHLASAGATR